MSFLESKILLTLSYTDQFNWPLTVEEIKLRLINLSLSSRPPSRDLVLKKINNLINLGLITKKDKYFCLKSSAENFKIRVRREKSSKKKWQETAEFINLIKNIPRVRAVFVTGSLAMNSARENDDIDFLIITGKNTLWLLRPIITFLALLNGKARLREFHAENTWCLNMWLEEDALQMPKNMRNIYTAYEVCQVVPILDKNNIAKKFLKENSWVENYLPQFYKQKLAGSKVVTPAQAGVHTVRRQFAWARQFVNYLLRIPTYVYVGVTLLSILNALAFVLQRLYMSSHMSHEKVDLKRALFHPRDTKNLVFKRWQKSLSTL